MTLPTDSQFRRLPLPSRGIDHHYGDRVCLHSLPFSISLLTKLSSPSTTQPLFNNILRDLYGFL